MGEIRKDNLHESLIEELNELANIDLSGKQDKTDESLLTESKDVIGAINELFQSANNGKELIANAIGEPVSADDTFSAMSSDINSLLSTFKTNMMNNGITVESGDKFKQLIDKIATMVEEGSGKGIQFVRKDITLPKGSKWLQVNDLGFKANIVMYDADTSHVLYNDTAGYDQLVLYPIGGSIGSATYSSVSNFPGGMYINENGFRLPIFTAQYTESNTQTTVNKTITIIAIGVGEEDTTLRDSLASILQEEGVSVTEEDDMASLISKVDEEFSNSGGLKVNLVTELPEVGKENQMYIINDNINENVLITPETSPTFDGIVVSTTTDSNCPNISFTKGNTTELYRIFMVSRAITPKPILAYYTMIDGEWVKHMNSLILFSAVQGDSSYQNKSFPNKDITGVIPTGQGGYTSTSLTSTTSSCYLFIDAMESSSSSPMPCCGFNKAIDVTYFNTLRITGTRYSYCRTIYLYASETSALGNGFSTMPTYHNYIDVSNHSGAAGTYFDLDVSGLEGWLYLGIYLNYGGQMQITKIELLP